MQFCLFLIFQIHSITTSIRVYHNSRARLCIRHRQNHSVPFICRYVLSSSCRRRRNMSTSTDDNRHLRCRKRASAYTHKIGKKAHSNSTLVRKSAITHAYTRLHKHIVTVKSIDYLNCCCSKLPFNSTNRPLNV